MLAGSLLFFSGRGPARDDGTLLTGVVGRDVTVEEAYQHARVAGLQLIAAMKAELGELDRVVRIVKVLTERRADAPADQGEPSSDAEH